MFRPDILVSDVFMRGMTGLEAAIEVKTRVPSCEILLMSGSVPKVQELQDCLDDGRRFEILAKPIHPLDLLAKLRSLVRSF
jgi:CheY-like chemotaxis protein